MIMLNENIFNNNYFIYKAINLINKKLIQNLLKSKKLKTINQRLGAASKARAIAFQANLR